MGGLILLMRRLFALFLGIVWMIVGFQAHAASLQKAVEQAVATHPSIAASRAARNASVWDMKAAQSRLLPQLDLSADLGPFYIDQPQGFSPSVNAEWMLQREVTLTLSQILYDGGDRSNDIRRSAALADALSFRIVEQSESVALDAVEAYIDVRRLAAILDLARKNRKQLNAILGLVRQLTSGGSAPASDLDQALGRVAGAATIEKQIEQALDEGRARYRQIIGAEPQGLEKVKLPPGIPKSRKLAVDIAIAENSSILALDSETSAAEFALAQGEAGFLPTVRLQGVATTGADVAGTPGSLNSLAGQVNVQWNLYQGMGTSYRTRALKERVSNARLDQQVRERKVKEVVERAYAAYTVGTQRVSAARDQTAANQRVNNAYQQEYKGGKRRLLDLLDAQNASFTSQFQLTSAQAVHVFSAYQLLGAMNHLQSTFGLRKSDAARADFVDQSQQGVLSIDINPLR